MSFNKTIIVCAIITLLFSCNSSNKKSVVTPNIIPKPLEQNLTKGVFVLSSETKIEYDSIFKISGRFLKSICLSNLKKGRFTPNTIQFVKKTNIINPEGYELDIQPKKITISSSTNKGAFYAVQSLIQLLPNSFLNKNIKLKNTHIQCLNIKDEPQFEYRGMHLDVSRHFYSVDFIKSYIDALAMLKMNTFHWHLTDDQGWRIEIKKYPNLQKIAAFRDKTLIGHYNTSPQKYDNKRYGGYYTQKQIKHIVKYAEERAVTIIPEIEMPGHSQAAIAAYPYLSCHGKKVAVAKKWGVFETIFCTKDSTFQFIENVLDEVIPLFPSKYIHIGGDEAPKTQWKTCKDCQKRMVSKNLANENELQNYFITRIETYLNSKGKQIIGWDEILEGGLAPNATIMSWRGVDGAIKAAQQRHNVIMTPTSHTYLDYYQSTNDNEPLAIGGYLPLEKVYHFNPIPKELNQNETKYILGAQGNVWTEYITTTSKVEYMVFPRMIALSEVVWSSPKQKNYTNFIKRLEHFNKRLDALNINYANHLYEVEGQLTTKNSIINYELSTIIPDKTIRFTQDGSLPTLKSKIYQNPIILDRSKIIKAAVFNHKKQLGTVFTQNIKLHKAVGETIHINKSAHKSYSGSGANGLINGISGSSKRYGDKEWLGFFGEEIEITITFKKPTYIKNIESRFYNAPGQWIYAPKNFEVKFDDTPFVTLYTNRDNKTLKKLTIPKINKTVTKITIKIPDYGIIPDGQQGAGQKAWTFIDEIIIN